MYHRNGPSPAAIVVIGALVALVLGVAAAFGLFFTVEEGESAFIYDSRHGTQEGTYGPGWHSKTPFFQDPVVYDVRVRNYDTTAEAATKDRQEISVDVRVRYSVAPSNITWIYKELGTNDVYASKVIPTSVQEAVKASTAKYDIAEIISNRDELREHIVRNLGEKLAQYRINLDDVDVTNIVFDPDYAEALKQTAVAKQQKDKEMNLLEAEKIRQQQQVVRAEAASEKARIDADAKAYSIEAVAKAEANATRILVDAIAGNDDYITYKWVEAWRDGGSQIPKIMGSGDMSLLLPTEQGILP